MIEIDTRKQTEVIDITRSVERELISSTVQSGICLIYTLHTTTGITVNEAEEGIIQDIIRLMNMLVPQCAGYGHDRSDGNAHAHLRSMIIGNSAVIPIEKERLILGTWQRILFIEQDGPRHRRVYEKSNLRLKSTWEIPFSHIPFS